MLTEERLGSILVVDDDQDTLAMVTEYFSANGFDVFRAKGGRDALTLIDVTRFDVVLLDIMMPGVSGVEVLRQMRLRRPELPVIMLSGIVDVELAKGTLDLGAFDYVCKPIFWDQLYRCVTAAISRNRAPVPGAPSAH